MVASGVVTVREVSVGGGVGAVGSGVAVLVGAGEGEEGGGVGDICVGDGMGDGELHADAIVKPMARRPVNAALLMSCPLPLW